MAKLTMNTPTESENSAICQNRIESKVLHNRKRRSVYHSKYKCVRNYRYRTNVVIRKLLNADVVNYAEINRIRVHAKLHIKQIKIDLHSKYSITGFHSEIDLQNINYNLDRFESMYEDVDDTSDQDPELEKLEIVAQSVDYFTFAKIVGYLNRWYDYDDMIKEIYDKANKKKSPRRSSREHILLEFLREWRHKIAPVHVELESKIGNLVFQSEDLKSLRRQKLKNDRKHIMPSKPATKKSKELSKGVKLNTKGIMEKLIFQSDPEPNLRPSRSWFSRETSEISSFTMFTENVDDDTNQTDEQRGWGNEDRYGNMSTPDLTQFVQFCNLENHKATYAMYNNEKARFMPNLSQKQYSLLKIVEVISALVVSLRGAQSKKHALQILFLFITTGTQSVVSLAFVNFMGRLVEDNIQQQASGLEKELDETVDDNTFLYTLKHLRDMWKMSAHSKSVILIKQLIGFSLIYGVLDKSKLPFAADKAEKLFGVAELETKGTVDLIDWAFDFTIFIAEKGVALYNGDSFVSLFYDSKEQHNLHMDYVYVTTRFPLFDTDQLWKVESDSSEYRIKLHKCRATFQRVLRAMNKGPEYNVLSAKYAKVEDIHIKIVEKDNNQTLRGAPYAISLFGKTGVGKSSLLPVIENFLLRCNGFDPSKDGITSLNPSERYQSDLETKHICVVFDDAGNARSDKADGNHIDLCIKFINNNMVHAIKADLSQKGQVLVMPKLLFATTNVQHLDAGSYSNAPESALRRFPCHITMTVKDNYQRDNSNMLDPTKMREMIEDAWWFTVNQCIPTEESYVFVVRTHPVTQKKLENIGIKELLEFLKYDSNEHFRHQDRLLKSTESMHKMELCSHHMYPELCNECNLEHQAGFLDTKWQDYVKLYNSTHRFLSRIPDRCVRKPYMKLSKKITKVLNKPSECYATAFSEMMVLSLPLAMFSYVFPLIMYYIGFLFMGTIVLGTMYLKREVALLQQKCINLPLSVMKKTYSSAKNFAGAALIISIAYGLYSLYKTYITVQGDILEEQGSVAAIPKPENEINPPNMWKKPIIMTNEMEPDIKTMTHDQLTNALKTSLGRAEFSQSKNEQYKDKRVGSCIFSLGGNMWLAPWHVLKYDFTRVKVCFHKEDFIGSNFSSVIGPELTMRIPGTDMGVVQLTKGCPRKDTLKYFPTSINIGSVPATFLTRNSDMELQEYNIRCQGKTITVMDETYDGCDYNLPINTQVGMCMSPLIAQTRTPFIMGFHSGGKIDSQYGVGHQLTRSQVESTLTNFYKEKSLSFKQHVATHIDLAIPEKGILVHQSIHEKSPANYLPDGSTLNHLGTHTGTRRHFKSEVIETKISPLVNEYLGEPRRHGPPLLKGYKPWQAETEKITNTKEVESDMLEKAFDDLNFDIQKAIDNDPSIIEHISPLHIDANLAGVDGVNVINAIDLSTSMGWPHNTPKRNFIYPKDEEVEGITCPKQMDPVLAAEVDNARKILATGKRCNFVSRASLKDEPTKLGKDKVRVFCASPAALIILTREYFLPISKFVQEHGDLFECAVGTNAYGTDWSNIAERVLRFEPKNKAPMDRARDAKCAAGDFQAFDSYMSMLIVLLSFKIMILIAKRAGYSDEQIIIMEGIATEISAYIAEMNGEFILNNGSNPSGHSLTVIVNDIGNSLYMRYAYYYAYNGYPPANFRSNVSLVTYGDDNLMGINPAIIDKFNHTVISNILGKSGIVYTMADKSSESRPVIPFTECTFLKRNFVWSDEVNQWLGPIEELSILKSLHAVVKSKVLTMDQQCDEVVHNALREYFYFGEEKFNLRREQLLHVVNDSGFSHVFRPLPFYGELLDEYVEKYC